MSVPDDLTDGLSEFADAFEAGDTGKFRVTRVRGNPSKTVGEMSRLELEVHVIYLRMSLKVIATDLYRDYPCKCGDGEYTDGNQCPVCFTVEQADLWVPEWRESK